MRAIVAVAWVLIAAGIAGAANIRLPEGNARGFLVVRSAEGQVIGHGELWQLPVRGAIESRLSLAFTDGSRREETVVFSQDKTFRLESYRLVERGPLFPGSDIAFDRKSGQYKARVREKKGE